nr:MAG TPA: hypothetical protein [Caudoviricetes sp.]
MGGVETQCRYDLKTTALKSTKSLKRRASGR